MLDSFEILTTSGVVLWSRTNVPVSASVVNSLISDVFIEERASGTTQRRDDHQRSGGARHPTLKHEKYTVKWATLKDLGLIFTAVYQSLLHLSWVDTLLDVVRDVFAKDFGRQLAKSDKPTTIDLSSFDRTFDAIVDKIDKTSDRPPTTDQSTSHDASESELDLLTPDESSSTDLEPDAALPKLTKPAIRHPSADPTPVLTPKSSRASSPAINNRLLAAKSVLPRPSSRRGRKAQANPAISSGEESSGGRSVRSGQLSNKVKRRWDATGAAVEGDDVHLDYSTPQLAGQELDTSQLDLVRPADMGTRQAKGEFVLKDLDDEVDAIIADSKATDSKANRHLDETNVNDDTSRIGAISAYFRSIVSGRKLSKQDLVKPLKALEDHLVQKNVAREAAVRLCESVERDLVGYKTGSFANTDTIIRESMSKALARMLTPTTSLDLLRSINNTISSPSGARPYVISIVGVNGVGKSTNLSKIAYFLIQNNFRILVCAADTFRSGAVEQLGVHVRNLTELSQRENVGKVELFEKGYGKDAAIIARDAVIYAHGVKEGANKASPVTRPADRKDLLFDVVLIDTAGRRHNDTRLMSSLTKFGQLAKPDKIFMVGEALVGTDSVAQARNFSAQFVDQKGRGRGLDGFIISKCDTVGDMVGTLVSMVYATGIPVVFLGVGQHYGDLRGLNVRWAVDKLMN